jgi:hypothetical protein
MKMSDLALAECDFNVLKYTGNEQNNGNTKTLRNRIRVGYIERTSAGNTECSSSLCLQPVVLMSEN